MRCICCNEALSDFEATRRLWSTNEFLDMCNACFAFVKDSVEVKERYDLKHEEGEEGEDDE